MPCPARRPLLAAFMPVLLSELDLLLKRTFGYASFRPLQREICEASLDEAWLDIDLFAPMQQKDRLKAEVTEFNQISAELGMPPWDANTLARA